VSLKASKIKSERDNIAISSRKWEDKNREEAMEIKKKKVGKLKDDYWEIVDGSGEETTVSREVALNTSGESNENERGLPSSNRAWQEGS